MVVCPITGQRGSPTPCKQTLIGRQKERARARETRVSPSRGPVSSYAHLFLSACYAGYESVYKVYDYQNLAQIRPGSNVEFHMCQT